MLAGDAVVLEPEGLRRKQRRVKKLDAEKKTRRKTQIRLPVKTLQPATQLLPLESLTVAAPPRKSRSNGNGSSANAQNSSGKARSEG